MENTNKHYHELDQKYYVQTFKRYPIVIEKGVGAKVWDVEGKEYLDMLSGIAVNNMGHCHPAIVKAIQDQAATLMHISNFYLSKPQVALSKKLVEISKMDRVFLANSGAEAVEGAIKLARKYAHSKGRGGTVIAMHQAFHGRTLATVAATGKKAMENGFWPIPAGFCHMPLNDIEAIKRNSNEDVGAIMLEPVQGEGGINVADKDFVKNLRKFCDEENIALIFDEVQSGMGRTGHWYAKDYYDVQPDVMSSAKGLGGGMPIGAVLINEKVHSAIEFGDHGTTFGGNPLASSAALATIEAIENEDILAEVFKKGKWLRSKIMDMKHPSIMRVKGLGLMLGVEFTFETKNMVATFLEHGILTNATAGNILRLVPPLNISYAELEQFLNVFETVLKLQNENIHA